MPVDYFVYKGPRDSSLFEPGTLDVEGFLEHSRETEMQHLEPEHERIQTQLDRRDGIREDIIDELESKLDWYVERLEAQYQVFGNQNKEEKEDLKEKIQNFYKKIRVEGRKHWRDMQKLEQKTSVMPVWINCWQYNTRSSLLTELLISLGYPATRKGRSVDELLSKLREWLDKNPAVAVALDEFDQLDSKTEVIYDLPLLNQETGNKVGFGYGLEP